MGSWLVQLFCMVVWWPRHLRRQTMLHMTSVPMVHPHRALVLAMRAEVNKHQRYLCGCWQGAGGAVGTAVLRGDRHVVSGLCSCWALPWLASVPGCQWVWSDPIHHTDARASAWSSDVRRCQDRPVLQTYWYRRLWTNALETEGESSGFVASEILNFLCF